MMRKQLYFKRFRMEVDLRLPPVGLACTSDPHRAELPDGCMWQAWHDSLVGVHAEVKARCFHDEPDTLLFPSLGSLDGCLGLMDAIRRRPGFCPAATWLVATGERGIATIQGVIDEPGCGSIQNVGVEAAWRGLGLGRALVLQALAGFQVCGARRASLEVTESNRAAMNLYRSLGFRCTQTVYRTVPLPEPVALPSAAATSEASLELNGAML